MTELQGKLISGFELTKCAINTPLLLFYFELGVVCTKFIGFVE